MAVGYQVERKTYCETRRIIVSGGTTVVDIPPSRYVILRNTDPTYDLKISFGSDYYTIPSGGKERLDGVAGQIILFADAEIVVEAIVCRYV